MERDLTGWCRKSAHDGCGGVLLTATGHHWWCACACHPEMPEPDQNKEPDRHRAWQVWRQARQQKSPPPLR